MRLMRHCSALLLVWASCAAVAQQYPARPIRVLISFPAGSAADIIACATEPQLHEKLGQSLVIDNREGAGGMYRAVTDPESSASTMQQGA